MSIWEKKDNMADYGGRKYTEEERANLRRLHPDLPDDAFDYMYSYVPPNMDFGTPNISRSPASEDTEKNFREPMAILNAGKQKWELERQKKGLPPLEPEKPSPPITDELLHKNHQEYLDSQQKMLDLIRQQTAKNLEQADRVKQAKFKMIKNQLK